MARIGYGRVSTADQDLGIQLSKLREAGRDAVRAEIRRQRSGKPDDPRLAGHVMHEAGHNAAERARRHVDDAAPAALLHARGKGRAE